MDSKYSIHCIDQCLDTKWKAEDGLPKCSKEAFEAIKAAIASSIVPCPRPKDIENITRLLGAY
jgi:hypothetical protein